MYYKKILAIIQNIAERELADFDGSTWIDYCFLNPLAIPFLAKMVCLKKPFKMITISYDFVTVDFNSLVLHQEGEEWYLGCYSSDSEKDFKNFQHFFRLCLGRHVLCFTDEHKRLLLTQYVTRSQALLYAKDYVIGMNNHFDYTYEQDFIDVLARWGNTDIRLKVIVADCKGNFYITYSKIWIVDVSNKLRYVEFDCMPPHTPLPNNLMRGDFIEGETKIVQIQYKNRILYSTATFTEEEMEERDNYLMKKFKDIMNNLIR
jgi:DNA-binding transcriptional regulator/RsmH inhibitor MraZ